MDSKKIYLVTVGEYSDYRVLSAFSTNEKAIAFIDWMKAIEHGYEEPRVKELFLDTQIEPDYDAYRVVLKAGEVVEVQNFGKAIYRIDQYSEPVSWVPDLIGKEDVLVVDLWARSEEHAVKIASEKWFQMDANK